MGDTFSFAPLNFMDFLDTDPNPYDISSGLSDDIAMIKTEPVPPTSMSQSGGSITDRIAQTLAGDRYYGVTPEDKDRALSEALIQMGSRLGAAAGAGSWSKAYPLISQMIPQGYDTFNKSMAESEQHRMAIQDRIDQLKLRELNMKKANIEDERLTREEAGMADLRAKADENAVEWRNTFDSIIGDPDIPETDRAIYKKNMEMYLQMYKAKPDDPQSINSILTFLGKVGDKAGLTEVVDQKVGLTLHENWLKDAPGIPFEQYLKDQRETYGIKLKVEQEGYALAQAKTAETLAGANQANAYARYLDKGGSNQGGGGGVSPTNIWNDVRSDLEAIGKDSNLLWMMQEIAKDPSKAKTFAAENPLEFSRIQWVYGGNEINSDSAKRAYQLVTDPTARAQAAAGVTKSNPVLDISGARENPMAAGTAKKAYDAMDQVRIQALMNGSKKRLSREEAMKIYDGLSEDEKKRVDNYIKMNLAR